MKKLHWINETRKVDDLIDFDFNPRKITDSQMAQLQTSLDKYNLVEVPAVDGNLILAGHQRVRALRLLGRGKDIIDVRAPSRPLTQKEREEYIIRSNKNGGSFDYDVLANQFEVADLKEYGFTDRDFGLDMDEPEEKPKKEKAKKDDTEGCGCPHINCCAS